MNNTNNNKTKSPKIVLIDDDPIFLNLMEFAAEKAGFEVESYASLGELGHLGSIKKFDLAIVDYQLEQMTGVEIAEYFSVFFADIPLILVSANREENLDKTKWPKSITRFVSKHEGFSEVLNAARSACNMSISA